MLQRGGLRVGVGRRIGDLLKFPHLLLRTSGHHPVAWLDASPGNGADLEVTLPGSIAAVQMPWACSKSRKGEGVGGECGAVSDPLLLVPPGDKRT